MAVDAVLFDMDGVLVHSHDAWYHLCEQASVALGYGPLGRERFEPGWGQGIQADIETWFPRSTAAEVEAFYEAHFAEHLAHVRLEPCGPAVFAELREMGARIAVVTNTSRGITAPLLAAAGLAPDAVVCGPEVPEAKPAPDMLIEAARRLGVPLSGALMVGDSRFDRDAARAAGVRFAGLGIAGDLPLARLEDVPALARGLR